MSAVITGACILQKEQSTVLAGHYLIQECLVLLSFLFCLKETFCYSAHTVLSKHLEWVIAPLMEIHLAWSEV